MSDRHARRLPRPRSRAASALLLCGLLAACRTIGETPRSPAAALDRLPRLSAPARALAGREQIQAKATLELYLGAYLRDGYEVVDRRFFLSAPGFSDWAALTSRVGGYVRDDMAGEQQFQAWQRVGIDNVAVWRIDPAGGRYIAIAMSGDRAPVAGDAGGRQAAHVIGYFELTKLDRD